MCIPSWISPTFWMIGIVCLSWGYVNTKQHHSPGSELYKLPRSKKGCSLPTLIAPSPLPSSFHPFPTHPQSTHKPFHFYFTLPVTYLFKYFFYQAWFMVGPQYTFTTTLFFSESYWLLKSILCCNFSFTLWNWALHLNMLNRRLWGRSELSLIGSVLRWNPAATQESISS